VPPVEPPTSRRLTLPAIVDAAAALVAAEGLGALSMRTLARRLDVGAMTLYGYVRTKEQLLGLLADRFFAELELPEDGDWQERIAAAFRSVREVFVEHPELIPIVGAQRVDGIAAYRGAELVLGALREAGLSDPDVVSAFDALTSLVLGSAHRQASLRAPGTPALGGIQELSRDEFGNVISLAGQIMTRDPARDFEVGLDLLIRGIASRAAA
jgi:AcrR family transcriptional regulator